MVSDDELDGYHHQPGMSKAELRRSNKPIMEKRRRARINHCLDELKALILDAMNKDPARHSKLEKADILEMTVKHLQTIQRQQLGLAAAADPAVVHKFKTGFHECAGEVGRYVDRLDGVEPGVKRRLADHLASCVRQMGVAAPPFPPPPAQVPSDDVNNNGASASARLHQMVTGLRLVPSRLPTGEIALLLPNSQGLPFFAPPLDNQVSTTTAAESPAVLVDRSRNSAFTVISRERPLVRSPLPSPTSTTASSYDDDSRDGAFFCPDRLAEVSSTSEHTRPSDQTKSPDPVVCFRPDSNPIDSHGLKALPHDFPTKNSARNISFCDLPDPVKTIRPLTVITSNDMLKDHPQKFLETKRNNFEVTSDYLVKKDSYLTSNPLPLKRPFRDDPLSNLLMKTSEFQVPQKIPKLYLEDNLQNKMERKSLHEIQIQTRPTQSQQNLQPERIGLLEIQNQPSASTSSEVTRDMWRPW